MMKKSLILVLALVFALSFAACGSEKKNEESKDETTKATSKEVTEKGFTFTPGDKYYEIDKNDHLVIYDADEKTVKGESDSRNVPRIDFEVFKVGSFPWVAPKTDGSAVTYDELKASEMEQYTDATEVEMMGQTWIKRTTTIDGLPGSVFSTVFGDRVVVMKVIGEGLAAKESTTTFINSIKVDPTKFK